MSCPNRIVSCLIFILFSSSLYTVAQKDATTASYTFSVADVEVNESRFPKSRVWEDAMEKGLKGTIEDGSHIGDSLLMFGEHSFVLAVKVAYERHYPLHISPDMIWLLICQGFTYHVKLNEESLKAKLVDFDGRYQIRVRRDSFIVGSTNNPWEKVIPEFIDSMTSHVSKEAKDIFSVKFSTTTQTEQLAFQVSLMDAMQNYFDYDFFGSCGIPYITISGSSKDWKHLKSSTKKLSQFGLGWLVDELVPILNEFIRASKQKENPEFWCNIYNQNEECSERFITGWITRFFPYWKNLETNLFERNPYLVTKHKGKIGMEDNNIPPGISSAPFVWNYRGEEFEMDFIAGFVGIHQDQNGLKPEIGWLVHRLPEE